MKKTTCAECYGASRKTVSLILIICSVFLGVLLLPLLRFLNLRNFFDVFGLTRIHPFSLLACVCAFVGAIGVGMSGVLSRRQLQWVFVSLFLCFCLAAVLDAIIFYSTYLVSDNYHFYMNWMWFVVMLLPVAAALVMMLPTRRRRLKLLRQRSTLTNLSGMLLCAKCNADLTAMQQLICPECGNEFMLGELMNYNAERLASQGSEGDKNEA